jgi:hypothetical protein
MTLMPLNNEGSDGWVAATMRGHRAPVMQSHHFERYLVLPAERRRTIEIYNLRRYQLDRRSITNDY